MCMKYLNHTRNILTAQSLIIPEGHRPGLIVTDSYEIWHAHLVCGAYDKYLSIFKK